MAGKIGSNSVIPGLAALLADTYTLALKTQNYHWNVEGSEFYSLHKLFEGQYDELHTAADELAERIRALGAVAPGSFKEFSQLASISEAKKGANAEQMLRDLAQSHDKLAAFADKLIEVSENADDKATADMATGRAQAHQKMAWMLKSSL